MERGSAQAGRQIEFPLDVAVCAWCKPVTPDTSGIAALSHGICPRHLRKMRLTLLKQARANRN